MGFSVKGRTKQNGMHQITWGPFTSYTYLSDPFSTVLPGNLILILGCNLFPGLSIGFQHKKNSHPIKAISFLSSRLLLWLYFTPPPLHPKVIQQILVKCLLWVRNCAWYWRDSGEQGIQTWSWQPNCFVIFINLLYIKLFKITIIIFTSWTIV